MLVISVEAWPGGVEKRKRLIARGIIKNDGTSTEAESGNYEFVFRGDGKTVKGHIVGFPRKEGALALLEECLDCMMEAAYKKLEDGKSDAVQVEG